MKSKGTLVIGGVAVLLSIAYFLMNVSYGNKEVRLRNQMITQQENNQIVYDNTWKIINQQAQVTGQYKEAFKEIYPALMEGRYGDARGGALLSFVTESNPNFNISLYSKLQASIEVQRNIFTREQRKLMDLKREHDNMRMTFPGSLFVGDRPEFEAVVVTSGKTEETFNTGQEDDVDLFQ